MMPAGGGYFVSGGSNNFFTPVAPNLGLTDDSVSAAQTMPFTFAFPGGSTNQLWISSNGYIWLAASTNNGCCAGVVATLRRPARTRFDTDSWYR